MKVKYEAMTKAESIRVRGLLCILQIPWSCTDSRFTEVDDRRLDALTEANTKLHIAKMFINELVDANGNYPEIDGTQLVQDAYAVLRKLNGETVAKKLQLCCWCSSLIDDELTVCSKCGHDDCLMELDHEKEGGAI